MSDKEPAISELLKGAVAAAGIRKPVRKKFWSWKRAKAQAVTAAQIRQLQNEEQSAEKFLIVDVRSIAESDVSLLPGAITVSEFERTADQYQSRTIIAYCTIGVRSGWYANRLKTNGWNAFNYKGSIIDWCKNKLPLVTADGRATHRVHTYNNWYKVPEPYEAVH